MKVYTIALCVDTMCYFNLIVHFFVAMVLAKTLKLNTLGPVQQAIMKIYYILKLNLGHDQLQPELRRDLISKYI